MAKYRMVNTRIWNDSFIADDCNALDRLLFVYLLTNERTNIIGVYESPIRTIAYETGIDKDDIKKMLKRLEPKVSYHDGWVFIHNFVKHQQRNSKVVKGMRRAFEELPKKVQKWVDAQGSGNDRLSYAIDTLCMAYDKPESELKPELKSKDHKARSKTRNFKNDKKATRASRGKVSAVRESLKEKGVLK